MARLLGGRGTRTSGGNPFGGRIALPWCAREVLQGRCTRRGCGYRLILTRRFRRRKLSDIGGEWLGPRPGQVSASSLGARPKARSQAPVVDLTEPETPRVDLPRACRVFFNGGRTFREVYNFRHLNRPLLCVDFHQVLDIHRISNRNREVVSDAGVVPRQVSEALRQLRELRDSFGITFVALSYLNAEERLRNLLRVAQASGFPVEAVVTTSAPTGRRGKTGRSKILDLVEKHLPFRRQRADY